MNFTNDVKNITRCSLCNLMYYEIFRLNISFSRRSVFSEEMIQSKIDDLITSFTCFHNEKENADGREKDVCIETLCMLYDSIRLNESERCMVLQCFEIFVMVSQLTKHKKWQDCYRKIINSLALFDYSNQRNHHISLYSKIKIINIINQLIPLVYKSFINLGFIERIFSINKRANIIAIR